MPVTSETHELKRYLTLGAVLVVFWLLLSGHFTPLFFFFAAASIAIVMAISIRMDHVDGETDPVPRTTSLIVYWIYLAIETIRANVDMVKRVWHPGMKVEPGVARIKVSQQTRMGKVIHANSITLTPGTVTLDIDEETNEFEIHSINHELIADLEYGEMDRRITRLEK